MGSWSCGCHSQGGSNWVCTCQAQGGSNWWTCTDVYNSFYLLNDACSTNQTSWTDPTISTSVKVKAQHINELRNAINGEQSRRHTTPLSFGADRTAMNVVTKKDTKDLIYQIEALYPFTGSWAYTYSTISKVEGAIITEVRGNLNNAENDCLCNCNYCTCQCNYCTCDCNYCTCDCNYCTCNCNYCTCNCHYSCTCNCNYSDERVKEEIEYI